MGKKLALILACFLLCTSIGYAEPVSLSELAKKLPSMKQGIAYSILDGEVNYLSTIEVAGYKGLALELGYAGVAENTKHKAVAVISYPLVKLEKYVDIPVLEQVELNVGGYVGVGQIALNDGLGHGNNELDYGISATLINLKF